MPDYYSVSGQMVGGVIQLVELVPVAIIHIEPDATANIGNFVQDWLEFPSDAELRDPNGPRQFSLAATYTDKAGVTHLEGHYFNTNRGKAATEAIVPPILRTAGTKSKYTDGYLQISVQNPQGGEEWLTVR